jgi:mono-ADP-ribosyltransferase sirtuin 6
MAHTAISDAEMRQEHYDPPDVLSQKVERLAEMVRQSHHMVAFTGAGISTSAGIPDFRGPDGKWTRKAEGLEPLKGVTIVDAYPTLTHMSLVELLDRQILKFLISQNCDGLHRRSGIPARSISELHGNGWVEICEDCGLQHFRDFVCLRRIKEGGAKCPADHFTGRFCSCGGRLLNSTIDFGQNLPEMPLERARQNSIAADLHLALGSSLRVQPACDQPATTAKQGGKLVIVNLQKTPLDDLATLRIFAKTDTVMEMLMARLSIPIPDFRLQRRVLVCRNNSGGLWQAKAVDVHDPSIEMSHICAIDWNKQGLRPKALENPDIAICKARGGHRYRAVSDRLSLDLKLYFMGHYREPPLDLQVDLSNAMLADIRLSFDPYACQWLTTSQDFLEVSQLHVPSDTIAASRVPDYGQSHRNYCLDLVMRRRNCDLQTAAEIVDQRVASSKEEALAAAGTLGHRRR